MKDYFISIDKTIRNFDKLDENIILSSIDLHENQWIAQEELWTGKLTKKAITLWNIFVKLIEEKYPHLIGGGSQDVILD